MPLDGISVDSHWDQSPSGMVLTHHGGLCNSDTDHLALLVLFAEARAQAKALDDEFTRTGKVRGPLHGVPVSFKDTCE